MHPRNDCIAYKLVALSTFDIFSIYKQMNLTISEKTFGFFYGRKKTWKIQPHKKLKGANIKPNNIYYNMNKLKTIGPTTIMKHQECLIYERIIFDKENGEL